MQSQKQLEELNRQKTMEENFKRMHDKVRGAALETKKEALQKDAEKLSALREGLKEQHKMQNYALSIKPKPKLEQNKDSEEEELQPTLTPVLEPEKVEYFASNVAVTDFEKDILKFAMGAGLGLTELELRALSKELGAEARKIHNFISDMYKGLPDAPKLKIAVIGGEVRLLVEGTMKQMQHIAENLGYKIKEVNARDIQKEANFGADATVNNALNNTPRPKFGSSAKRDEEEEYKAGTAPTPFKTKPSPYPK